MLVYGDPHYSMLASTLLRQLRSRLDSEDALLWDCRPLLIQAEQFEQGLSDCEPGGIGGWQHMLMAVMEPRGPVFDELESLHGVTSIWVGKHLSRISNLLLEDGTVTVLKLRWAMR